MQPITFVTSNPNKLKEVTTILGPDFAHTLTYLKIDLPEFQGDIDEICVRKAEAAYEILQGPCLVEDSSLCFNALNGLPGPYIKWFEQKLGVTGLCKLLSGFEDKTAQAVCTFGFHPGTRDGEVVLFQGVSNGIIVEPRGQKGFGWDVCFQPFGSCKTYAEFTPEEKNQISHRSQGLNRLKKYFECQ